MCNNLPCTRTHLSALYLVYSLGSFFVDVVVNLFKYLGSNQHPCSWQTEVTSHIKTQLPQQREVKVQMR